MTRAVDIARSAREQALAAAERKRQEWAAQEAERQAQKRQAHEAAYEAALPILAEWFPGVEWAWFDGGDYGFDTILHDASEQWPWSFMLCVEHFKDRVEIRVGRYVQDTSMPGYRYFSGAPIRSAADVGVWLEQQK
jgi:hypothetical protein